MKRAALLAVLVLVSFNSVLGTAESGGVPSHHAPEGGYRNPHLADDKHEKSLLAYLKMRWFGDHPYADHTEELDKIQVAAGTINLEHQPDQPRVVWLGHSSFLISYRDMHVLTDPILSDRASPVSFLGPERLAPLLYRVEDLPPIDAVVISHNHYDHLDRWTIERLGSGPQYLVPLGLGSWLSDAGIESERVREMDWWQNMAIGSLRVTATPAQHWSGRGVFDRYDTLWASWHLDFGKFAIWFAGDTGYNPVDFVEIGQRLDTQVALIPIGAYQPRDFMAPQHINPAEAIQIHNELGVTTSIGMHWSTFQLSAEPLDAPQHDLFSLIARGELERGHFLTLPIGGAWYYNAPVQTPP